MSCKPPGSTVLRALHGYMVTTAIGLIELNESGTGSAQCGYPSHLPAGGWRRNVATCAVSRACLAGPCGPPGEWRFGRLRPAGGASSAEPYPESADSSLSFDFV